MSADFSKLLAALAKANEEHADRDGLTGVRRAIFLDRGRHAPGEVCPTAEQSPAGERAWCYTCERYHEPMEWGEGCDDGALPVLTSPQHARAVRGLDNPFDRSVQLLEAVVHHRQKRRTAAGTWEVARPIRDTSWWHRRRQERACRKTTGHCWHPDGFVDWWCCMCSADTDGMPPQRCRHCAVEEASQP